MPIRWDVLQSSWARQGLKLDLSPLEAFYDEHVSLWGLMRQVRLTLGHWSDLISALENPQQPNMVFRPQAAR